MPPRRHKPQARTDNGRPPSDKSTSASAQFNPPSTGLDTQAPTVRKKPRKNTAGTNLGGRSPKRRMTITESLETITTDVPATSADTPTSSADLSINDLSASDAQKAECEALWDLVDFDQAGPATASQTAKTFVDTRTSQTVEETDESTPLTSWPIHYSEAWQDGPHFKSAQDPVLGRESHKLYSALISYDPFLEGPADDDDEPHSPGREQ